MNLRQCHPSTALRPQLRIAAVLAAAIFGLPAVSQAAGESEALQHYRRGSQAFVERRFDAAVAELTKSVALDGKQLGAIRLLGLTYQLTEQLDKAAERFREATQLAPKDAESWYYLGRVYYLQNFFDRSLSALNTAVRYAPADSRIRECLGLASEAAGDTARAQSEYEQAVRLVRENVAQGKQRSPVTAYVSYGAFLLKMNRREEGERLLLDALEAMPANWQANFELGKLYHQTDRLDKAVQRLVAALRCERSDKDAARTYGLLATVYSRLGRHEEAQAAAAAAVEP